jgi:hypothetical protein
MPFARTKMTFPSFGLAVSALGLGTLLALPADAQSSRKRTDQEQRAYSEQGRGGVTVWPRNTPAGNVVCWTACDQPNAIVLGADPDPFIRSQLLKDAHRYFGGGGL